MNEPNTIIKLEEVFQATFNDQSLKLTTELKSSDISSWDSLNQVLLIVEIENKFGFKFNSNEIETLNNVKGILLAIEKHS
jgi:acyl carrier protein